MFRTISALVLTTILAQPAGLPNPAAPARPWVRVRVEVQPADLILGTSGTSEVSVRFTDTNGQPVGVEEPEVTATAGSIVDVQAVAGTPGSFTAKYIAPAGKTPQIDAVTAVDPDTGALGWTPVRLAAKATIPVATDKPGAQVTVTFAGRTVGPVLARGDGSAEVDLVVPPGDWSLTVKAVDTSGNETVTTQRLPVPRYARVWSLMGPLACAPGALPGGWVDVLAVTPSGRPAQGAQPVVSSPGLAFSPPVELSPGHMRYAFVSKPAEPHKEKLTVRYAGGRSSSTITVGQVPDISEASKRMHDESEKALVETRAHISKTYELLERAREERDLVLLRCVQEKFTKMKALARVSERAHEGLRRDLSECRDSAVRRHHTRVTQSRDKVKRLSAEAEACLGDGGALTAHTDVNVSGPDDPFDEPDLPIQDPYEPPPDASPYM